MQSVRYTAYFGKRSEGTIPYRRAENKKKSKSIKQNTNRTAKFPLYITKGEFGFFYYTFIVSKYYAVGCRSPPNQFKSKNLD